MLAALPAESTTNKMLVKKKRILLKYHQYASNSLGNEEQAKLLCMSVNTDINKRS